MEATMLQRGDIVVERLTGKRAIVIQLAGPDQVTCRFEDGRPDDRYTFELEPAPTLFEWLLSIALLPFVSSRGRPRPSASVTERVRPMLVRQPSS
jgi:hypothetical protein